MIQRHVTVVAGVDKVVVVVARVVQGAVNVMIFSVERVYVPRRVMSLITVQPDVAWCETVRVADGGGTAGIAVTVGNSGGTRITGIEPRAVDEVILLRRRILESVVCSYDR